METTLHATLKKLYCQRGGAIEQSVGNYRVDVLVDNTAIEIQSASLSALREKIRWFIQCGQHVLIVKPFAVETTCLNLATRRRFRRRTDPLEVFQDLVHLHRFFPNPLVTVDVIFVDQVECRRRGRRRRRWHVEDRKLQKIHRVVRLRSADHLWQLLPRRPTGPFTTRSLADLLECSIWLSRMIVYTMARCGAARRTGTENRYPVYVPAERIEPNVAAR